MAENAFRAPRGTRDRFPEDLVLLRHLERTARRLARNYGYGEIRPPLFEETRLFTRSLGEASDVVEKEMFTVARRGEGEEEGAGWTFRPEGTAGVARAYVQGGFAARAPLQKWFYLGPMFRYERPQKGRERQFTQFGVEAFGSASPLLDAEVVDLCVRFFQALGLGEALEVRVNTMGDPADRERWRRALRAFFEPRLGGRCADCRSRFERNVFRLLDCKVEACRRDNESAPALREHLGEESAGHHRRFLEALQVLGLRAEEDPGIVRGLDYYTRSVFEVHYPPLGARSALCGGGRYDGLVEEVGGPPTPGVGFAIGFTPLELALQELGLPPQEDLRDLQEELRPQVYVVAITGGERLPALRLASRLRAGEGLRTALDAREKSPRAQFKEAGRSGARFAVVLGPEEHAACRAVVRDLQGGEEVPVGLEALGSWLRERLGA